MTRTDTVADLEGLRARLDVCGAAEDWEIDNLIRDLVDVRRAADLMLAEAAGRTGARSGPGNGGMARRQGHRSIDHYLASRTGGTVAEAERLRLLGAALLAEGDDAAAGAPVLPHLTWVARQRELSVDAFFLLRDVLMRHPDALEAVGATVDDALREVPLARVPLARLEQVTVDKARGAALSSVRTLVAQVEVGLTPVPDAEDGYEALTRQRLAFFREERSGMIRLTALLDPLTAAHLMAATDGYLKKAFLARKDGGAGEDDRTPAQMRADAFGWLGRHAAACEQPHESVATVVNVRMSLESLQALAGQAGIDGITRSLPVGALRRELAEAGFIPTVVGGDSEVLDQGRMERLFTLPQRRAIGERDRGCGKCGLQPSMCHTHHVMNWRHGGATDLKNGLMLCAYHHHWLHEEKWQVVRRGGLPWFVPPASVDPQRRPQPGHLAQSTLTDSDLQAMSRQGPW
ncbi:HNH endonuclease signature motif containing protein [Demequina subtropica]|uniref:HNH endonuclease signature motif containing protein n=1 Tax=Demequina subtropica TaxID=1638989 RepID=UPI0007858F1B|nr:HNH endonuclease signature motif containing protein [Demequina subtropica]